jgi:hypothetical protein
MRDTVLGAGYMWSSCVGLDDLSASQGHERRSPRNTASVVIVLLGSLGHRPWWIPA